MEQATATRSTVKIRPDTSKMASAKAPSGGKSYFTPDDVGNALAGLTVDSAAAAAAAVGIDAAPWDHLNPGQRRMAIGGAIRRLIRSEPGMLAALRNKADELRITQVVPQPKKRVRRAKVAEAAEPATEE